MDGAVEVAWQTPALLGEGALWDAARQRLLWVDVTAKRVGLFDPASGDNRVLQLDSMVSTVVPTRAGDLLVTVQEGAARLDPTSGKLSHVVRPEEHDPARIRFNDGKCDAGGRLWAGTMALDSTRGAGALYCFEPDGTVQRRLSGVSISNGIAWSPDQRRMYYVDTPTRAVDVFDFDVASGAIGNRQRVCVIPEDLGYPDGMTMDEEGKLWIAMWGGSAVTRWDPESGQLLGRLRIPTEHVTSCAFGGPDLDTLFVTTAREGLSPEQLKQQPLAGSIFRARPGVRGITAQTYAG